MKEIEERMPTQGQGEEAMEGPTTSCTINSAPSQVAAEEAASPSEGERVGGIVPVEQVKSEAEPTEAVHLGASKDVGAFVPAETVREASSAEVPSARFTAEAARPCPEREDKASWQPTTSDQPNMTEEKRNLVGKASGVSQKNSPSTSGRGYRTRARKPPPPSYKRRSSAGDSQPTPVSVARRDVGETEMQVRYGVGQVGQPRERHFDDANSIYSLEREKVLAVTGASGPVAASANSSTTANGDSLTKTRTSMAHAMIKEKEGGTSSRSIMSQEECLQAPRPTTPGAVSVAGIGSSPDLNNSLMSIGEYDFESPLPLDEKSCVSAEDTIVEAHTVEEDLEMREAEMEEALRKRIMEEAVEADIVTVPMDLEPEKEYSKEQQRTCRSSKVWVLLLAIVAAAAGIAIALIVTLGGDKDASVDVADSTTNGHKTTLELVKERGYVKCGTYDGRYGFGKLNDELVNEGFNIDQCKAISIAVFGVPDKYEPVVVTSMNRLPLLAAGDFDVLTNTCTWTMGRDRYDPLSGTGFTFSVPYFYSGLAFGGVPEYVACADELDSFNGVCRNLKICAGSDTTHEHILYSLLPGTEIIPSDSPKVAAENMIDGTCNVVASEPISMIVEKFRDYGYQGPFQIGQKVFSKEPLALVTREDDPEWSNLINFIVNVFFLAEAKDISKTNAGELKALFGGNSYLGSMAADIVSVLGNYGDLYNYHLQDLFPRRALNTLHFGGDTGLLYALPFGLTDAKGPLLSNSTLTAIVDQGYVRCGIVTPSQFASVGDGGEWAGLDVQFCRALSAALFAGDPDALEFVELSATSPYTALAQGEVDTVAGVRMTLEADFKEPATAQGFTFSTPFHYESGDAFAFVTSEEDSQWSDFVNWVVIGTFYAEEEGITSESSIDMPVVRLFGEPLKQMLRDMVFAVGSYADMYNSTMPGVPRSPINRLNPWLSGPQQFPIPFQ